MRFLTVAFGLLATLSLSAAQTSTTSDNAFITPGTGSELTAGSTTTLTWSNLSSGTVSLRLQWGATTVATDGIAIASDIKNTGTYSWTVPSSIPVEADYFIRISDDSDSTIVNYSPRFTISGVTGSASTTSASASSTSTSASSSSTSSSSTKSSSTTSSSSSSSTTSSSSSSSMSTTMVTSSSTAAVPSSTAASTTSSAASTTSDASKTSATSSATTVPNSGVGEIKIPFVMACVAAFGAYVLL